MDEVVVRAGPQPGRVVKRLLTSSLGLKYVMAITGLMLVGFLVAHAAGNLLIFQGQDAINNYSLGLHKMGGLLWAARLGLLGAAVLHIYSAVALTLRNKAARPVAYAMKKHQAATYAARTMRWSGVIVLAYIVYHLAHFTWGKIDEVGYQVVKDHHDVYNMVVRSFGDPKVAGTYIVAVLLTGWHLSHGIQSLFQSLGVLNTTWRPVARMGGTLLAWAIALAFVAVPLGVQFKLIQMMPIWKGV